jgi:hypothetical protein
VPVIEMLSDIVVVVKENYHLEELGYGLGS